MSYVTNNVAELIGAIRGMEACPQVNRIYTDSMITLYRIRKSKRQAKLKGVPAEWQQKLAACKKKMGPYEVILLAGHPTVRALGDGWVWKKGRKMPVSRHNVYVDELCSQAKMLFSSNRMESEWKRAGH
jgi:ribonuclease HI